MNAAELKGALSNIKLQLFDAPDEVKSSFNRLVKHFSAPSAIEVVIDAVLKYAKKGYSVKNKKVQIYRRVSNMEMKALYDSLAPKLSKGKEYKDVEMLYMPEDCLIVGDKDKTILKVDEGVIWLREEAKDLLDSKIKK